MVEITKDSEITMELINELNFFQKIEWPNEDLIDVSKLDNIKELLHEAGDTEEELDSNYLTRIYFLETENMRIESYYSQYRKDGGLCQGEWSDSIFFKIKNKTKRKK